jgi:hypothetical protein
VKCSVVLRRNQERVTPPTSLSGSDQGQLYRALSSYHLTSFAISMPPTLLQARIKAFENLKDTSSSKSVQGPLWDDADDGLSLTSDGPDSLKTSGSPSVGTSSPSIIASSPSLSMSSSDYNKNPSLIDLREWVVDDGPTLQSPLQPTTLKPSLPARSSTPLITLNSVPNASNNKTPPSLPPRKPSITSLKTASLDYTVQPQQLGTHKTSDSLSPIGIYAYTPGEKPRNGHNQTSSISSMHSVSLSDGGDGLSPVTPRPVVGSPENRRRDYDIESLDESFETLSTTSSAPPFEWPTSGFGFRRQAPPPKLPALPSRSAHATPLASPSASLPGQMIQNTNVPYVPRRAPPIPPRLGASASGPPSSRASVTSASDRSSILSTATNTTSRTSVSGHNMNYGKPTSMTVMQAPASSLLRPTPIPMAARARYEAVFIANIRARRRHNAETAREHARDKGRKTGWRGLSVDLVTNAGEADDVDSTKEVGVGETLNGATVAKIWSASHIDRMRLRSIW